MKPRPYDTDLTDAQFGLAEHQLPHDFPPWTTVHTWYPRWRIDGTWRRITDALRPRARRSGPAAPGQCHRQPVGQDDAPWYQLIEASDR